MWNPYTDQKNRAYSNILTSLFPEQTKTIPRIIVWSLVFLADLIAVVYGGYCLGLLDYSSKLVVTAVAILAIGVFWLEGVIWYGIPKLFVKKEETWL